MVAEAARALGKSAVVITIVATFTVMKELDRLIGQVVTATGATWQLATIETQFLRASGAWTAWHDVDAEVGVMKLVGAHAVTDIVFALAYGVALWWIIRWGLKNTSVGDGVRTSWWIMLSLLVGADIGENVCVLALARYDLGVMVVVEQVQTVVKLAAAVGLLARMLLGQSVGARLRAKLVSIWYALYAQRLGVVLVLLVAVLTLATGHGVQDQLPDVIRGWITYTDDDETNLAIGFRLADALWAAGIAVLVAIGLFHFGRQRGFRYLMSPATAKARRPGWFVAAGGLVVLAVLFSLRIGEWSVDWPRVLTVLGVLVAVPLLSILIAHLAQQPGRALPDPFLQDDVSEYAEETFRIGDLVAPAWLGVAILAPFVALVPPVALMAIGAYPSGSRFRDAAWPFAILEVVLFFVAVLVPWGWWLLETKGFPRTGIASIRPPQGPGTPAPDPAAPPAPPLPPVPDWAAGERPAFVRFWASLNAALCSRKLTPATRPVSRWLPAAVAILAGLAILGMALWPQQVATIGPLAIMFALVGAWSAIVGWLILALGRNKPSEVFVALRLRSTPVIAMTTVIPLVVAAVVTVNDNHSLELASAEAAYDRLPLDVAFRDWVEDDDACVSTIDVGGETVPVRFLTLVAAEGGGIRAAAWTVDVLRELPRESPCAAQSVFLSAGNSGGAVGLSLLATHADRDAGRNPYAGLVSNLAGDPQALSADATGLLSSDLIADLTGLRVPSFREGLEDFRWRDRSVLQADAAGAVTPALVAEWDTEPHLPVGYTVFNSTDTATTCKVIISQIDVGLGQSPAQGCAGSDAELPNTIDLLEYLGTGCPFQMTWATAMMLSARFPFVSPSARVTDSSYPDGCTDEHRSDRLLQLLDGGVLDNSALGTLGDLYPRIGDLVRDHNRVLGPDEALVVPIVLFVSNEPGGDVVAEPARMQPEIVAPLNAAMSAGPAQRSPAALLTRIAATLPDVCGGSVLCRRTLDALGAEDRPDFVTGGTAATWQVVVVSPSTTPAVTVPLGWSLSAFSQSLLRDEAREQAKCGRDPHERPDSGNLIASEWPCLTSGPSYSDLGSFLYLFERDFGSGRVSG